MQLIETRVEALRASTNAGQNDLGARAYAGDADAYSYIVNHKFKITDTNGKKRDFGAYNDNPAYAGAVKTQIANADKELPQ